MIGRRGILALIGTAPVAAGTGVAQASALLASPGLAAAVAAGSVLQDGETISSNGILGPVIGKQLKRLKRQMENEIWTHRQGRQNGLDADIAALKSTARVYKERQQRERDDADDNLLRHVDHVMWGE